MGGSMRRSAALERVETEWDRTLETIQVRTPDDSFDVLMNRWLIYQNLTLPDLDAIRVLPAGRRLRLSRSAAGRHGAAWSRPDLAREHILRAAGRQFREGDVQHWWHEPGGQGLRSRCSDDLLWLPFVGG